MSDTPAQPSGPAGAVPHRRDLDRSLIRGVAWTGGSKWATQLVRWGSTLVIARILSRADYGIMGMAAVYLGLVQLVNEFGLSASIIQQRELRREQLAQLAGLSTLVGFGFAILSVLLAPLFAIFFETPVVKWVIVALACTFILRGLQVVPRALLNRDLRFRQLAMLDAAEALSQAAATLVFALLGFAVWALVLGSIAGVLVATIIALATYPQAIAWPRRGQGLRKPVTFGSQVAVARVSWFVYSNADFAIVGKMLGADALGAYSIGWTLANMPVERVSAMIGRVAPAIFSAVQQDLAAMRRYLLRLTEGLAMVTMPAAVGLSLVADDFVLVVLGEKWRPAIMPLRLLCFYGGFRSVTTLFQPVLVAARQAHKNLRISLMAMVVLPVAFVIGAHLGGTTGVAAAWLIAFPLVMIPSYLLITFRVIEMRAAEYVGALRPALTATAAMAVMVLAMDAALRAAPAPLRLGACVASGAAVVAFMVMTFHRDRVRALLAMVRDPRGAR